MSNAFTQLRAALATDLLAVGVPVHDTEPAAIDAPCLIVSTPVAGTYIEGGSNFGDYVLNIDVVVLVDDTAPAAGSLAAVEDLLAGVLANTVDWALTGVEPPAPLTFSATDRDYLGTLVHLSKATRLA